MRPDLLTALRSLPPKLSAAIVLRHYHGYTNREIGAALGVSERTVGTRLQRAAERLRVVLEPGFSLPLPSAFSSDNRELHAED
jgi:RNA polymerase sigma factor (sigma-70 family)